MAAGELDVLEMVEAIAIDDAAVVAVRIKPTSGSDGDHVEQLSEDEEVAAAGANEAEQPREKVQRAALRDSSNGQEQPPSTRSSVVPASSGEVPGDARVQAAELLEPPNVDLMKDWAAKAFVNPSGTRVELPALSSAYQSTQGLLINCKEAIRQLFEQHRKELCSSPERPDLKLSQEEGLGWLLAYALGRQLLDHEARPIGKLAGTVASGAKKECDGVRDAAKSKRGKARKRSATAEEMAAIDKAAEVQRAAIFLKVHELCHMPAANTVIVESSALASTPAREHVCSDACSTSSEDICPRARALLEAALSNEAAALVIAAFTLSSLTRCGGDANLNEELQLAEVRFSHALRRFKCAYPEFCVWGQRSEKLVVDWTIRLAAHGRPIPAAEAVARRLGFDMDCAVSACKARMEAAE